MRHDAPAGAHKAVAKRASERKAKARMARLLRSMTPVNGSESRTTQHLSYGNAPVYAWTNDVGGLGYAYKASIDTYVFSLGG